MSRSQSKAEYGRFAHLFVGGVEWLLSQWQALTGGEETDLHSHAASAGGSDFGATTVTAATGNALVVTHTLGEGVVVETDVLLSLRARLSGVDPFELLRLGVQGDLLLALPSGKTLTLRANADGEDTFNLIEASNDALRINLSDDSFTEFTVRSRGSNTRKLISAGYNDSGEVILGFATGTMGFFGTTGVPRPEVPASPTVQNVVDALKALGLITQAS